MRLIFTLCRPTRLTRQRSAINGRLPTAPFICIREPPSSSSLWSLSSSRYLSCLFPLRTRPLMHALRAISGRCSLSTGIPVAPDSLFPVLTSDRSSEREEGREGGGDAGEGGAIRATAAAATSALAAATAASRCKESCARERAMAKSRGQTCYERKKDLDGKERGTAGGTETYLGRAKERPRTGSEASQRRQDRRRQPAITSWNVWERVGLDPKGPTTTKSPSSLPSHPFSHVNGYTVRPLPCTG